MTSTAEELRKTIRSLTEQLAELTGNRATDTKEPLLYGSGTFDVRVVGGKIQIGIASEFGWMLLALDASAACALSSQLSLSTREVLQAGFALAELVETGRVPS